MAERRIGHSATMLTGGRVLIVGGIDGIAPALKSAELYDPGSGRFSRTGAMLVARRDHTATLLGDGRVLICGGRGADGRALDEAELYDPATGKFSPAAQMAAARVFHTATLLSNGPLAGRVLIAGGGDRTDAALATAELYDPASGKFSDTGAMATARAAHTATLLAGGEVLVAGGGKVAPPDIAGTTDTAEVFDPSTQRFTPTAGKMTLAREQHTATLQGPPFLPAGIISLDESVLIAGGTGCPASPPACATLPIGIFNSAELYDPLTRRFRRTGSMRSGRALHTATFLTNGLTLIAGGWISTPSAEIYYPPIRSFSPTSRMIHPRFGHTATRVGPAVPCPYCAPSD
jgi:galactose oxidase-like protein